MKKLIAILPFLISTICLTAGAKGGFNEQDTTGIITQDIATAVRQIEDFTYDTEGYLVICVSPNRYNRGRCNTPHWTNEWQHVRSIVPRNRTYVGFKVVSREYGYRQLEVYWK